MTVISQTLRSVLAIDASQDAIDYDGRWYSWGDVAKVVTDVSSAVESLGLGPDARVGVMSANRPGPLAAILSVLADDACLVSVNPMLPEERLAKDISGLKLPVLVGESAVLTPAVRDIAKATGTALIELRGVLDGAGLVPGQERPDLDRVEANNPGVIIEMLTSGTTGTPKRIRLDRDAFIRSYLSALSYEKGRSADDAPRLRDDVVMLTNPLSHIGGLWGAVTCFLDGRKGCLVEKFSVDGFRNSIVRHRPPVASAVPAALRMILDADIPREDLASLRAIRTGTAPLDPAVVDEFMERYGIPILQNYGATEFAGAVAGWTLKDFYTHYKSKPASVGRFQPGVSGRVVEAETGDILPAGEEGILEMKARQFGQGDAWLRTTDRAVIDADGFLFILGRADNAIIRGGFKVHPDDVVTALEQHPAVREAIVVGLPDRRLGAVPAAAIILKQNAVSPTADDLAAFSKQHLLPYQVPVRFLFVDDVPRTPSLKPSLPLVRNLFEDGSAGSA